MQVNLTKNGLLDKWLTSVWSKHVNVSCILDADMAGTWLFLKVKIIGHLSNFWQDEICNVFKFQQARTCVKWGMPVAVLWTAGLIEQTNEWIDAVSEEESDGRT